MEVWREIPGYEGKYQVSDLGRVRSFVRGARGRILRPGKHPTGETVALGRGQSKTVHSLVMLAFVGPRPDGLPHIAHLNGDNRDNRLLNLKYATRSENEQHKVRHGKRKLTAAQVRELRAAERGTVKAKAVEFGIAVSYAYCLRWRGAPEYRHAFMD